MSSETLYLETLVEERKRVERARMFELSAASDISGKFDQLAADEWRLAYTHAVTLREIEESSGSGLSWYRARDTNTDLTPEVPNSTPATRAFLWEKYWKRAEDHASQKATALAGVSVLPGVVQKPGGGGWRLPNLPLGADAAEPAAETSSSLSLFGLLALGLTVGYVVLKGSAR